MVENPVNHVSPDNTKHLHSTPIAIAISVNPDATKIKPAKQIASARNAPQDSLGYLDKPPIVGRVVPIVVLGDLAQVLVTNPVDPAPLDSIAHKRQPLAALETRCVPLESGEPPTLPNQHLV